MLYLVHLVCAGFEFTTLVVIDADCRGSCKSNYHTITTTKTPNFKVQQLITFSSLISNKIYILAVFLSQNYWLLKDLFENRVDQDKLIIVYFKCF